jgi:pimeloyl-ACP methyl ester carboxylesterase
MARDVLAFLDRRTADTGGAGDGRAVLVGHSMGGKVAQSLALMHPARVAGLVVLDIAPVRYGADPSDKGGESGWRAVEDIVRLVARVDLAREGAGRGTTTSPTEMARPSP